MNKEIKDRIEKIEEGIVPEGYKKTKLGIIPENWEVKKFEDISKLNTDRYYPNKTDGIYECIELEHIDQGNGILKGTIISKEIKSTKNFFDYGDVLYGKLRPYLKKYYMPNFKGICSTEIWVLQNNKKFLNSDYLYYIVQTQKFDYVANISTGSSMPRADWEFVGGSSFAIPTLREQEKIADILSTWDKSIETIEKFIKEKETQKKGLMQQLLTGETRLPGFNGDWKEVKLGEVSKIVTGTTPPTKKTEYYGGDFPWVTPTDIGDDKYIIETERNLSEEGMKVGRYVPKNSLLITCIASIGKNTILKVDGSCNQQINAIYPSNIHSNEYLYYLLSYKKNYLLSYASKTATMLINKNTFESIKFNLPPLPEQKAIAEVLSTADKEIELLRELLENKKTEKKGLMQLLLTGIVRV